MLEPDDYCTSENGDLSLSLHYSPVVNSNSPNSPSLQRYISAPEFVFRKATSVNLSSKPILNDKESWPSELPKKDPHEARRHRMECDKIMQNITRKHQENLMRLRAEQIKRNADAEKAESRINYWVNDVIPNWDTALQSIELHADWWHGIPSSLRCQVHCVPRMKTCHDTDLGTMKRYPIPPPLVTQKVTFSHYQHIIIIIQTIEIRRRVQEGSIKTASPVVPVSFKVRPTETLVQVAKGHDNYSRTVWRMIISNPLGITRELFEGCLSQSQHTIRRLDRERILAEGYDLSPPSSHSASSTKYATLPIRPLPRTSRVHSLPAEGDGENGSEGSGEADHTSSTTHPRTLLRKISFNVTGVETLTIPRKVLTAPNTPLAPPPSLSISGDLSSNQESSLQVIQLDVSRTFPMLGVFQSEGSHLRNLHDLLAAYVAYQPTLGYLQGMSFIAGILLIVMDDIYTAFIAFATLMNRPSFYAFYSLDESEFATYFGAFDALLEEKIPKLSHHLKACRLDSKLYLFDWLFTVFSRSLPLEVDLRIWDLFLRDGEAALILAALGILKMYEDQLLPFDFDHLASFLTGPMPESMSPDILTECMRSLDLSTAHIKEALQKARTLVAESDNKRTGQLSPPSVYDPRAPVETARDSSESLRSKWSLRSLRVKQVNGSRNRNNNSEMSNINKFISFRRKNASPGSNASNATNGITPPWSQDVCLEFPKREML
ncbi:hypothetical protein ACTXT7_008945 [Hymenolepis weldensis]